MHKVQANTFPRFLKRVCDACEVRGSGSLQYPSVRENVRRVFLAVAETTSKTQVQ